MLTEREREREREFPQSMILYVDYDSFWNVKMEFYPNFV